MLGSPYGPSDTKDARDGDRTQQMARRSRLDLRLAGKFTDDSLEGQTARDSARVRPTPEETGQDGGEEEEGDEQAASQPRFTLPKSPVPSIRDQGSKPAFRPRGLRRAATPPPLLRQSMLHKRLREPLRTSSAKLSEKVKQPKPSCSSNEEDHQASIMIGIDFGTTYSGVAWAYSKQAEDIKIVTNWDSEAWLNSDKGKAPTEIAYEASPSTTNGTPGTKQSAKMRWGYDIGDMEAVKWFKLLLLDRSEMGNQQWNRTQIKGARRLLQKAGKSAVEAVADYLRLLWTHAIANIKKDFGEIAVDGLPFRVVLTVPAVWSTNAVKKMREAAIKAGILNPRLAGDTTLHFVSEPEAAALATFEDLKSRPNFEKDDTFVVCDAGGGTVDLISYKVGQSSPMLLRESVEGKGKLCGAVFLDQDFEALMEQFLGDAWKAPEAVIKEMMNVQWENGIKRGFEGQERDWKITLPYECMKLGAPHILPLASGYVREMFDNVVDQVRALVNDQIAAVERKEGRLPKAIVLVGGFGSCRYLFNCLNKENKARGIEVYQSTGAKPWTAICRGAVFKALTNSKLLGVTVNSRISRHSYGTKFTTKFDKNIHLETDKAFDPVLGEDKAENQLTWYLRRGDKIEEADPVRMPWVRFIPADSFPSQYTFQDRIYYCESPEPPSRLTSKVKSDYSIQGELDVSNTKVFDGADGNSYKELIFYIEMKVIGTALEFALNFEGQKMAHCNVEVDLEDDNV